MSWYKFSDNEEIFYASRSPRLKKYHGFQNSDELIEKIAIINEGNNDFEVKNNLLIEYYNDISSLTPVEIPNGVYMYKCATSAQPEKLVSMQVRDDRVLELLPELKKISDEITWFRNNREVYEKAQTRYARSFMIYGPPGTGKSSWLRGLARDIDAIVIYLNDIPTESFISQLNQIDKLKIIIFEEFVTLFEDYTLSTILQFLDGEFSPTNCISFVTTNHPEKIPENVIRCGRVDQFYRIGYPDKEVRKKYFKEMFDYDASEDDLKHTANLAVADLKEVYLVFLQRNITIPDAVKVIKERHDLIRKDFGRTREISLSTY
jgi:SpoVK/Ycf46/Vps4 family AAA+-type ATPase